MRKQMLCTIMFTVCFCRRYIFQLDVQKLAELYGKAINRHRLAVVYMPVFCHILLFFFSFFVFMRFLLVEDPCKKRQKTRRCLLSH